MANHILTIDATKFNGAEIIKKENSDGYDEEGIFIPLERNDARRGKKGTIFFQFYIVQKRNDFYFNQTHYVTPKYTKKFLKHMADFGYKRLYLGHVTPCWDKAMNKITHLFQIKESKGFVKMSSIDKEDGDE